MIERFLDGRTIKSKDKMEKHSKWAFVKDRELVCMYVRVHIYVHVCVHDFVRIYARNFPCPYMEDQ